MKQSRRHRWIEMPDEHPPGDSRTISICRDCGLEVASQGIKSGGHGPCAGKACEHQHELALISGDPQALGNQIMTNALLACAGCGKGPDMMIAHRNDKGEITGWLFTCGLCYLHMIDHEVIIRPVVKERDSEAE